MRALLGKGSAPPRTAVRSKAETRGPLGPLVLGLMGNLGKGLRAHGHSGMVKGQPRC